MKDGSLDNSNMLNFVSGVHIGGWVNVDGNHLVFSIIRLCGVKDSVYVQIRDWEEVRDRSLETNAGAE